MALILADRVRETSITTGTGTLTLAGAVTSYQSFAAVGNANTTYYTIVNQNAAEWEVGIGTYTSSGTTLSRDTVLSSSNSGSLVNFSAGTKDVWGDYPAGKAVTTDTLAYPPAIGGTAAAAGTFTTLTGTTSTTTPIVQNSAAAAIAFKTNSATSAVTQFNINHTASAVNYLQVTGGATGGAPVVMSAQGSDTNVNLTIQPKGTGSYVGFASAGGAGILIGLPSGSANYFTVASSNAGSAPILASAGSDANISLAFQPKGTGAIDLAAGSSGVNISNGGTVTAITKTVSGSGYTSFPSVAISIPTTAGGVQATASVTDMSALGTAVVVSGGTGYTNGDVLTPVGGTGGASTRITVSAVSGGVITAAAVSANSPYTVLPTNPVSVTGGTGSGATFNLNYAVTTITLGTAGSGYVEQPTVTFSGGGGSGAAAYASVGATATIKGLYGGNSQIPLQFNGPNGAILQLMEAGTSSTASTVVLKGPQIYPVNANTGLALSSNGNGAVSFYTNVLSQQQMAVTHTASAVNYVQVTGAVTGSRPTISVQGSDTASGLSVQWKGTGNFFLQSGSGAYTQFRAYGTNSAVNNLAVTGTTTGNAPSLSVEGTDGNIDLALTPKGTGALVAQASDGGTTINARGANAVDWQTKRSSNTMVANGSQSVVGGGENNVSSGTYCFTGGGYYNGSYGYAAAAVGGVANTANGAYSGALAGYGNTSSNYYANVVGGNANTAAGYYNFIGGGFTNSGTASAAVTTQSATMNGTTAVTLAATNANIKVGQYITGTSIAADTYVAAISGTSLTLSKAASGSSTSTLSFYTPHSIVVGGGNNQATGSYSFIGGGGDAGTAANRNVASGDWSVVGGGKQNTASGYGSFIGGGGVNFGYSVIGNTAGGYSASIGGGLGNNASGGASFIGSGNTNLASGLYSAIMAGGYGNTRSISGNHVFPACNSPIAYVSGVSQAALLILGTQTTDATSTVLRSDPTAASGTNQVILPNNSAYYFRGEVIAGVTGGGNTKGWTIEGVIKRGVGVGTTALVGTPTVMSSYADVGAATWTIGVTADTTNGGLAVTFTGQAATTIRCVAQIRTTEMTF